MSLQPFEILNQDGHAPLLLLCDHASNRMPQNYAGLGVDRAILEDNHIAWDIGAASVTRGLSERLNAPALLGGYSRLLIDLNRPPGDPASIPPVSDGVVIPGNQDIDDGEAEYRLETFFWPYHQAVTQILSQLMRHGPPPAVVAVHSCTPVFAGFKRPWHIGVTWNHDPRIAQPLLAWLREQHDFCVGDNQPYSGREIGFTLNQHAEAAGLPNAGLEIRQDLLGDDAACQRWAALLAEALEAVLSNESLHQVRHY